MIRSLRKGYRGRHLVSWIKIDGKWIQEGRYVMSKNLGRVLERREEVHHINGDTTDNRIENLKVLSKSDHGKEHHYPGRPVQPKKEIELKKLKELRKKYGSGYNIEKILGIGKSSIYRRFKEYGIT